MLVGKVIPEKDGDEEVEDVDIAVGLPIVGSVSYSFQVAPEPSAPPVVLKLKVPVVTPLQTPLGVEAMLDGFEFCTLTVTVAVIAAVGYEQELDPSARK